MTNLIQGPLFTWCTINLGNVRRKNMFVGAAEPQKLNAQIFVYNKHLVRLISRIATTHKNSLTRNFTHNKIWQENLPIYGVVYTSYLTPPHVHKHRCEHNSIPKAQVSTFQCKRSQVGKQVIYMYLHQSQPWASTGFCEVVSTCK